MEPLLQLVLVGSLSLCQARCKDLAICQKKVQREWALIAPKFLIVACYIFKTQLNFENVCKALAPFTGTDSIR